MMPQSPVLASVLWLWCVTTTQATLYLSCEQDNDLYQVLKDSDVPCRRFETPGQAVAESPANAGILILARDYPRTGTRIEPALLEQAARKALRLYIEFPQRLPGMRLGKIETSPLARGVVTSDLFGEDLAPMRILAIHGCHFVTVEHDRPHLVLATVAGYNTAVYGLPPEEVHPMLVEHTAYHGMLVAATKLSQCVTGRYGPHAAWEHLWKTLIQWLDPAIVVESLTWQDSVRPAYGRHETLPAHAATRAVVRGVDWYSKGNFLVHPAWKHVWLENEGGGTDPFGPPMDLNLPTGDGSLGILEGHASRVDFNGNQQYRYWMRADCQAESALALSMRASLDGDTRSETIANNLMNYMYSTSNLRQGPRNDPNSPTYGLMGWATTHPHVYYGDDNARVFLGSIGTAANLHSDAWDKRICELILANFRTTGQFGFRGPRLEDRQIQSRGWPDYWQGKGINIHPHFESWMWTSYLWLYDKVGYEPLLTRTRDAIRRCMEVYPNWKWTNGIQQERGRMILVLAWLIRVDDTVQHRTWLKQVAKDMLAHQDECGGIQEEVGKRGGQYGPPTSNAAYGTNEAPLIQANGDPAADMLYTTNFAFFGLNEAARATGDVFYHEAVNRMADFLIRIQSQSDTHPDLDGTWFRGFDMDRWEYWGSNADHGWGVWGTLTGWTQNWIVSTLALQQQQSSLWDLTQDSGIGGHFERCRRHMLPDDQIQLPEAQRVEHDAVNAIISLSEGPSTNYPGEEGAASLVDGLLDNTHHLNHTDPEWLGFQDHDLEATIDLQQVHPINSVSLHCMQQVSVGIFLPTQVDVYVSEDGIDFQRITTVTSDIDVHEAGPLDHAFQAKGIDTAARFLKIVAKNLGTVPDWHRARGAKAWLFVDEILVNGPAWFCSAVGFIQEGKIMPARHGLRKKTEYPISNTEYPMSKWAVALVKVPTWNW